MPTNAGAGPAAGTGPMPPPEQLRYGPLLNHDPFDLVDGDRVRRPVVELRRLRRCVPGDPLRVLERPSVGQVRRDPPSPRNVWQQVDAGRSAAAARRLIMASTSRRDSARPVSRRPAGSTLWKSGAFGSSSPPASR